MQSVAMKGSADRLAFADLLRGLAAPAVMLGHFTILYLTDPRIVALITQAELYPKTEPSAFVDFLNNYFNFASIGVAVFFLISGFVIPLSLEGTDVRAYFFKRFLRIFPTYWISLAIGLAAIVVSAWFWSKSIPHDATGYLSNLFLAANAFSRPDILSVGWTLQIEVKFYLLAPLVYLALKRGTLWPILLCAAAITGVFFNATVLCDNVHVACWDHYRFAARMLWFDAMFVIFMLIGSMFYALYRNLLPKWQAIGGMVLLWACYNAAVAVSPLPFLATDRRLPYFWGLVIFTAAFLLRDKITLARPFRFLANISYPLYLIHPLVGYVTMRLLIAAGLPYIAAFAIAVALVLLIAGVMHTYVEAPLIALGKRLSRAWFGSREPRAAVLAATAAVRTSA